MIHFKSKLLGFLKRYHRGVSRLLEVSQIHLFLLIVHLVFWKEYWVNQKKICFKYRLILIKHHLFNFLLWPIIEILLHISFSRRLLLLLLLLLFNLKILFKLVLVVRNFGRGPYYFGICFKNNLFCLLLWEIEVDLIIFFSFWRLRMLLKFMMVK